MTDMQQRPQSLGAADSQMLTAFGGSRSDKDAFLAHFDTERDQVGVALAGVRELLATEGEDLAVVARRIGYPPGLLLSIERMGDTLIAGSVESGAGSDVTRDSVLTAVRVCFANATPGADLSPIAGKLAIWLLKTSADLETPEAIAPAVDDLRRTLEGLYRRRIVGETVARTEWAGVRREAAAINATLPPGPSLQIGLAIEAGGWDPTSSPVVLLDLLQEITQLHVKEAWAPIGWSDGEKDKAQQILRNIVEETIPLREAGDDVDYRAFFQAADPDLYTRSGAAFVAESRARAELYKNCLDEISSWVSSS